MERKTSILICEDQPDLAEDYANVCREIGYEPVSIALNGAEAMRLWQTGSYDALWMDLGLNGDSHYNGYDFIKQVSWNDGRPKRVFIYSGFLDDEQLTVIGAVAHDRISAFHKGVEGFKQLRVQLQRYAEQFASSPASQVLINSEQARTLERSVPRLVQSDLPILIIGGTGGGKSHWAKRIAQQIVDDGCATSCKLINCAAIPPSLFESELFGHLKGSFSGAVSDRLGKLMSASGFTLADIERSKKGGIKHPMKSKGGIGVVILDEIATLPLHCQAKLLSVLDGSPMDPVGYDGPGFAPKFRVIATTNESEALTNKDKFRPDLLMRLKGWVIKVPSLSDQPDLVSAMISNYRPVYFDGQGQTPTVEVKWEEAAVEYLTHKRATLLGGVRELRNVISRASMFAHFSPKKTVSVAIVNKALEEVLPMEQDIGDEEGSNDKSERINSLVTKLKSKLEELGEDPAKLVAEDSCRLCYIKIRDVLDGEKLKVFHSWIKGLKTKDYPAVVFQKALSAENTQEREAVYALWQRKIRGK